jgi:hypothetical protein
MGVELVVAVTDRDWFDHLRAMPNLAEVNFWSPSDRTFRALQPGELFLFKLHAPRNFIVGGGWFAHATTLPCSLAWEAFGEENGAATLREMRSRIARYTERTPDDRDDFRIGCRILTQPFFLPEYAWIPTGDIWSRQTVSFKTYATDEVDGMMLWDKVQDALSAQASSGFAEPAARYGEPTLVRPRLGQGAFRILVTDNYRRSARSRGKEHCRRSRPLTSDRSRTAVSTKPQTASCYDATFTACLTRVMSRSRQSSILRSADESGRSSRTEGSTTSFTVARLFRLTIQEAFRIAWRWRGITRIDFWADRGS